MQFLPQERLKKSSVLTMWASVAACLVTLGAIVLEYGNYSTIGSLHKFDESFVNASIRYASLTALSVIFVFVGQLLVIINLQRQRWLLLLVTALTLFINAAFLYKILTVGSSGFDQAISYGRGHVLRSPKFEIMLLFFYWHLIGFIVLPIAYRAFNWLYGIVKDDFFSSNKPAQ